MSGYVPVDQNDIPESRHAIFIRGFPADMKTDKIRDFFNDQIGHCAFDFTKISPDGTRLFVALRFDDKDAAKECFERFNETNVLGHRVSFQWFRDIRRYVSYHQSRGIFPPPRRGGFVPFRGRGSFIRGGFSRGYNDNNFSRGRGYYNRGRPPLSYNPHSFYNRPRSRSPSRNRSRSRRRSRSRSRSRSPSHSSTPHTRSVDRTPNSQRSSRDSPHRKSASPQEVVKKVKKHKKNKKRARDRSQTPDDVSVTDLRSPDLKRQREHSDTQSPRPSPPSPPPPLPSSQLLKIPNGGTLESRRLELVRKTASTTMLSSKVVVISDNSQPLQPTALSIRVVQQPEPLQDGPLFPSTAATVLTEPIRSADRQVMVLARGSLTDSKVHPTPIVVKKEIQNATILNPVQIFLTNIKTLRTNITNEIEADVDEIKNQMPVVKKESGMKLSVVTKQGLVETQRKQKVDKLPPPEKQMVNAKQKDLDLSYQSYYDTFTSVLKIMTEKDAEIATLTETAKNDVLADHKNQLSEELDEFIELLMQG